MTDGVGVAHAPVDVRDLHVTFGQVAAVSGVDLRVRSGGSVALVGRNGAGKSTTLRVLGGVLPPSRGSVLVAGVDAAREPRRAREVVGYCPDVGGLIPAPPRGSTCSSPLGCAASTTAGRTARGTCSSAST